MSSLGENKNGRGERPFLFLLGWVKIKRYVQVVGLAVWVDG